VLDGKPALLSPKRGTAACPQFSAHVAKWLDRLGCHLVSVTLASGALQIGLLLLYYYYYGGRPRSGPYCVRWGPSSPSPKKGAHFQAYVPPLLGICPMWIKMPLGMEVSHGSPPSPPPKRGTAAPTLFGRCLLCHLWSNGRPSQKLLTSCCINCDLNICRFAYTLCLKKRLTFGLL